MTAAAPLLSPSPFTQYADVQRLEDYLGSPLDAASPLSFAAAVELDKAERFPAAACACLDNLGLSRYYVPSALGGEFRSFETVLSLIRSIARRDLTVAIGHGKTYLGAMCVWLAGNDSQKRRLADLVLSGQAVSLALTEPAHGADLLSNELRAIRTPEGWQLNGEKWLINNATRSSALTIFARTDEAGGARGFSLFLAEKASLAAGSFTHLPKIRTHGIRGADISGIRFDEARLGADALVGIPGRGLEITIKGLQLSRVMCAGLSLGAADTALRTTLDFAASRQLYGNSVLSIAYTRRQLAQAFADLLVCDCLAITAARALHLRPAQMSVHSAIVKYLLPTMAERIVQEASVVLGARYYLRQEHQHGIFEKMLRDNRLIALFDGSTVVNQYSLALQLRQLIAPYAATINEALFDITQPLPEFDGSSLSLSSRGENDVLAGFAAACAALPLLAGRVDKNVLQILIALVEKIAIAQVEHAAAVVALPADAVVRMQPAAFDLAERYCQLHAAANALQFWIANRDRLTGFFAEGHWLVLGLGRLVASLGHSYEIPNGFTDALAAEMEDLHGAQRAFSVIPIMLDTGSGELPSLKDKHDGKTVFPASALYGKHHG